ncbi:hypothetical protein TNCV_3999911 [Trichonephila clavipes]|nr:hypothetical protein TNCV_3999911 [Trichonephila clavipes]
MATRPTRPRACGHDQQATAAYQEGLISRENTVSPRHKIFTVPELHSGWLHVNEECDYRVSFELDKKYFSEAPIKTLTFSIALHCLEDVNIPHVEGRKRSSILFTA